MNSVHDVTFPSIFSIITHTKKGEMESGSRLSANTLNGCTQIYIYITLLSMNPVARLIKEGYMDDLDVSCAPRISTKLIAR